MVDTSQVGNWVLTEREGLVASYWFRVSGRPLGEVDLSVVMARMITVSGQMVSRVEGRARLVRSLTCSRAGGCGWGGVPWHPSGSDK